MKDFTINFANFPLYVFVLAAIAVYMFLVFMRLAIPALLKRWLSQQRFDMVFPAVELLVWTVFISWAISYLYPKNLVVAIALMGVLLLLVFWISRFMIKELVAGISLRVSGRVAAGDIISFGGHTGRVVRTRWQHILLAKEDGGMLQVPNSQILETITGKSSVEEINAGFSFELSVDSSSNFDTLQRDIKLYVLQLPWASLRHEPLIELLTKEDKHFRLKITVFTIHKSFAQQLRQSVKNNYRSS